MSSSSLPPAVFLYISVSRLLSASFSLLFFPSATLELHLTALNDKLRSFILLYHFSAHFHQPHLFIHLKTAKINYKFSVILWTVWWNVLKFGTFKVKSLHFYHASFSNSLVIFVYILFCFWSSISAFVSMHRTLHLSKYTVYKTTWYTVSHNAMCLAWTSISSVLIIPTFTIILTHISHKILLNILVSKMITGLNFQHVHNKVAFYCFVAQNTHFSVSSTQLFHSEHSLNVLPYF